MTEGPNILLPVFWPSGLWQVPGLCSILGGLGGLSEGSCLLGGLKALGAVSSAGAWGLAWKKPGSKPRLLACAEVASPGWCGGLPEGAGFVLPPEAGP